MSLNLSHITESGQSHITESGQSHGPIVALAAKEGSAPFRVRKVNLELTYDATFNRYRLYIEVRYLTRGGTGFAINFDRDDYSFDPDREIQRAAEKVFQAFRYPVLLPIPHNIILGEN